MPNPVDISLPIYLQALGVLNAWVLKPAYMLLGLFLLVRLARYAAEEIRWLWWGLVAFEIGEFACAVNFLGYQMASVPLEMTHNVGMVVTLGLFTMATLEIVDRRMLFQFAKARSCALVRFCRECPVRAGSSCRFKPLFVFVCSVGVLVSILPFTKPPVIDHPMRVQVFGHSVVCHHLPVYQMFENRVCPAAAVALFGACLIMLWRRNDPALFAERVVFSFALGCSLFAIFRFANHRINWDYPIWFDFWEESLEWVTIAGVALTLHLFRDRLLDDPAPAGEQGAGAGPNDPGKGTCHA
ncbi:MAG: hypothetical protein HY815_04865 [Candidatus Riflebacteria bacterium]|nr:hypothetical protein [Candidatus Riflebacteria bacterium]